VDPNSFFFGFGSTNFFFGFGSSYLSSETRWHFERVNV
jgi:hypothetical protein